MATVKFWTLLAVIIAYVEVISSKKKLLCYYDKQSLERPEAYQLLPEDVDGSLCTHLLFIVNIAEFLERPFHVPDIYHRAAISSGLTRKLRVLLDRHPNLKLMISVGGWREGSYKFSLLVGNDVERSAFIHEICRYIREIGFHGVDINWQWPTLRRGGKRQDKLYFALFVKELKGEIVREGHETKRPPLLLSVVLPQFRTVALQGFEIASISRDADLLILMSMDYYLSTDPEVNHHAPLYSPFNSSHQHYSVLNLNPGRRVKYLVLNPRPAVISSDLRFRHSRFKRHGKNNQNSTVNFYLTMGVEASKMILGIPFYGRSFVLDSQYKSKLGSAAEDEGHIGFATNTTGILAYFEICINEMNSEWSVEHPDENSLGPYASKDKDWVAYDDPGIIRKKVEFALGKGLGGVMVWTVDMDDFRGSCLQGKYPLLNVASETLSIYNDTYSGHKPEDKMKEVDSWELEDFFCLEIKGFHDAPKLASFVVETGHLNSLRCLVKNGLNLNARIVNNHTLLHIAVINNHSRVLRYLVKNLPENIDEQDQFGYSALYYSSTKGYVECCQLLLKAGADPRIGPHGRNCIHAAAYSNKPLIIREIHSQWNNLLEVKDIDKKTPISLAIVNGNVDSLKELVKLGVKVKPEFMFQTLESPSNQTSMLQYLLLNGGDIDSRNKENVTLLIKSIQKGLYETATFLVMNGANVNAQDERGRNSLHEAILSQNVWQQIIFLYLLINKGVDVNETDKLGHSALHYARQTKNLELCKFLMEKGADDGLPCSEF